MTIEVDASVVRGGGDAAGELATDVNRALEYFDSHIDPSQTWMAGAMMNWLLAEHGSFATNVESGLLHHKALRGATQGALGDVAQRFDETEYDAQVDVRDLFSNLDPTAATVPVDASLARASLAFDTPVGALVAPESSLADPAFEVVCNAALAASLRLVGDMGLPIPNAVDWDDVELHVFARSDRPR